MSGAVFDVGDERLRFVEEFQDLSGDAKVGALEFGANVVGAVGKAFLKGRDQSFGAIFDVDPITDLSSGSIDRERLIPKGVVDESGDEFLEVLAWPVVVGASGDNDILSVGGVRGLDEEVGAGLAGGVGRRGFEAGKLVGLPRECHRPVDFISGALQERRPE